MKTKGIAALSINIKTGLRMKGKYDIEIYDKKVHYFLTVERNITILQGNSATGKTELIRLIEDHEDNGASSGVTLLCEKACSVIGGAAWKAKLQTLSETIVFVDEGENFVKTKDFASEINGSSNYFVLINRDSLPQLPYSIEEIFGLRLASNSKYKKAQRVYNEAYQLYPSVARLHAESVVPELILTEDSNAGFDFYQGATKIACSSAKGKGNILNCLYQETAPSILIIADGAALGSEMASLMRYISDNGRNITLYAPESFEYLLLKANLVDHLSRVTDNTYEYIDSSQYISWEEFFTAYLTDNTKGTIYQYSKKRLAPAYLTAGSLKKIRDVFPVRLRGIIHASY